nr:transposase [bacterium]
EMLQNPLISLDGLCDILATLNPQSQMSAQALQQRINTWGASNLLSTLFCECLTDAVTPIFNQTPPQLLTPFQRILIQDSTTITLHEKLAEPFRGCGGSGAKSALKLHAVYDFHHHRFTSVTITDGATSEIEMGHRPPKSASIYDWFPQNSL